MREYRTWRAVWARLWVSIVQLTAGGNWSSQLPVGDQRNLRWFFFDGVLSAASDGIVVTYLTLFVLELGATNAQIGLMTALASLMATILLLPGAMLSDRTGRRKLIVLVGGGTIYRSSILLLALVPLFVQGPAAVTVAIIIKVIGDGFANLSVPAWTSLTADIVPLNWRGRYFGTRNIIMAIAGMAMTFLAGQMITAIGSPTGYQVVLLIAFCIGMGATFSYSRIREPHTEPREKTTVSYKPAVLVRILRSDKNFLLLCVYTIVWNMFINIAGPFFNVYLVRDLNATAAMVGTLTIVSSIASLPGLRLFGSLVDRWGPHRLQLLTGFVIPVLPLAWLFVKEPWQAIPINILGGFIWAGYGLASFSLLLALSPPEQRALYSAIFQTSVTLSAAIGAAVGGQVATLWSIPVVFAISGVGRLVAAVFFAKWIKAPEQERP